MVPHPPLTFVAPTKNSSLTYFSLEVYISDFGMARLKEEDIHTTQSNIGPIAVSKLSPPQHNSDFLPKLVDGT